MKTHLVGYKALQDRKLALLALVILLLITACARESQPPSIEEITFQSGSFNLVGDLRLPGIRIPRLRGLGQ
jgi:hypothetical protein